MIFITLLSLCVLFFCMFFLAPMDYPYQQLDKRTMHAQHIEHSTQRNANAKRMNKGRCNTSMLSYDFMLAVVDQM